MGKRLSCCKNETHNIFFKRKNDNSRNNAITANNSCIADIKYDETLLSLQHISERELLGLGGEKHRHLPDPSTNPTTGPLFVQRFSENNYQNYRKSQINLFQHRLLKKSSSCSTIFLDDCTVSHPNLKNMIKCVSMAVYYHIYNRSSEVTVDIFDEKIYPLETPPNGVIECFQEPDYRTIYRFIRTLFNAAQLSSECAIITLVYLERLLTFAELDIVPCSWRRIVLGAILLASKVWDDQAVWNVDYCQILRDSSIDDMNELERRFLEMIQFNINIPSSVYAKYYFELRNLAEKNDLIFPAEPLSEVRAYKLEAMSRLNGHDFISLRKNLQRSSSFDSIPFQRKSAAIIS